MMINPTRRRFLFVAPAIITASSLMPGHSITKLLLPPPRKFYAVFNDIQIAGSAESYVGYTKHDLLVGLQKIAHNRHHNEFPLINIVPLTNHEVELFKAGKLDAIDHTGWNSDRTEDETV